MGTAADHLGVRGRILVRGVVCGCIGGALLRCLLCQRFKLVDQIGVCGRVEILNLRGDAINLLDFNFAQSECGER